MRTFLKGAFAGGVGAALVLTATAAIAGTGIGGIFNLGQSNTVNATSALSGASVGAQLQVTNSSTDKAAQGIAAFNNSAAATLYGRNSGAGPGVSGRADKTNNGVEGVSAGAGASGVFGANTSTNGFGVAGRSTGASGIGVFGNNTGGGLGVWGKSTNANGVQGSSAGGSASGVYGENTSTGGYGIAGRAGSGGNAVFGDNTGSGYAGFFQDKVYVGGSLVLAGPLTCFGCVSSGNFAEPDPFVHVGATTTNCPSATGFDVSSPHFCTGWANYPSSSYEEAGFYVDPFKIVHLKGLVRHASTSGAGTVIMERPSYYCGWPHDKILAANGTGNAMARIDVDFHYVTTALVDGCEVWLSGGDGSDYLSLDGVTWSLRERNSGDTTFRPKARPSRSG
jgi:hypothetical protein